MRKTSQDGGDSTSITSGIENEVKKSTAAIAKIKRSSIKKKVQSFSHESDDGVIEPLLQKDKDKNEFSSQSAKFSLSKTKTDVGNDKMDDTDKLLPDSKVDKLPLSSFCGIAEYLHNGTKDVYKSYSCTANTIHNHMNTNIFSNSEAMKKTVEPKTQILVEIDGNKQGNFSSGPLIFTTAKIHTDGKNMQMEPVQVTPVPILSTVEGSVIKTSSVHDTKKGIVETSEKSSNNISNDVRKVNEEKYYVDNNAKKVSGIASCGKKEPTFSLVNLPDYPKVLSEEKKNLNNIFNSNPSNFITSTIKICGSNVMITTASKCTIPNTSMQSDQTFNEQSQHTTESQKEQIKDKKNMVGINEDIDVNIKKQLPICSKSQVIDSIIETDIHVKEKKDLSNNKQQSQNKDIKDSCSNTSCSQNNSIYEAQPTEMERISSSKTNIVPADYDSKYKIKQTFVTTYGSASSKAFNQLTLAKDTILQPTVTVSKTNTHPLNDDFVTTVSATMSAKNTISTAPSNMTNTEITATKPNIKTTTKLDGSLEKNIKGVVSTVSITNPPVTVSSVSLVTKSSEDHKTKTSIKVESSNNPSALSIKNAGSAKISPKVSAKAEDNIGKPIITPLPSEPILPFDKTESGKTSISITSTTASVAPTTPLTESISKTTVPINVSTNNIDKSNSIVSNKFNTSKKSADGSSSKTRYPVTHSVTTESFTSKPSVSVLTKTPQTSTKTTDSTAKTKKPSTSAVSSKIVQAPNAGRTSDSNPVTSKTLLESTSNTTISISTVVATSNQKSSTTNRSETQAGTTKPPIKSTPTITSPSAGVNITKASIITMNKTDDNQAVTTKTPIKSTPTVTSPSAVVNTTKASTTMNKTGDNQAVTTKAPIKSTPTVTSSSAGVKTTKASTTMNKTGDNQAVTTKAAIKSTPTVTSSSAGVNTTKASTTMNKTGDNQAVTTKTPIKSTPTVTSSLAGVNTTKASTTMNKTSDNKVVTTKAPIKSTGKIPSTSTINTATDQKSSTLITKLGDHHAAASTATKATETSQKPSTTNKSINLQSNEDKKEKLK